MKTRVLLALAISIGLSTFLLLFLFEDPSEPNASDDREDLIEVFHSNNFCSKTYRDELSVMIRDKKYEYKNDTIFQECSKVLELEKRTHTVYFPSQKQMKTILEYCTGSRDSIDAKGLSYSNNTHYIDTVTCEWTEFKGSEKPRPDLLP